ncbi:uncharacterized protein ARB_02673 [Trichophyton benhamiae CBS 112371]|uniref:Uncharacterized protein n=1 Tax=Arthroderma benhamiae (strain ATCC MYA-4681 / CBS 112371) TaxID=663331 RepID=D4B2E5_ARTBC|nr:uncharacterized protein ARB_02673 [Trichophyton benhamiae CBS 112371]EFE30511.1 hypothetical protein ARB_02673 [Trichophyton benhamiae CBS 112371]
MLTRMRIGQRYPIWRRDVGSRTESLNGITVRPLSSVNINTFDSDNWVGLLTGLTTGKKLKKRQEDQLRQTTSSPEHSPDESSSVRDEPYAAESESIEQHTARSLKPVLRPRLSSSSPPTNFQLTQESPPPLYSQSYESVSSISSAPMVTYSPYSTHSDGSISASYSCAPLPGVIPDIYGGQGQRLGFDGPEPSISPPYFVSPRPERYCGIDVDYLTSSDLAVTSTATIAATMPPYMKMSDPMYHYDYSDLYPISTAPGSSSTSQRY